MPLPKLALTAESLWLVHSLALGGKSAITGALLPPVLSACPPAVQGSHYAMALYAAIAAGSEEPDAPPGLPVERAEVIAQQVRAMVERGGAAPGAEG